MPPESRLAHAHFREAQTLAEELGMRPLEARCRLGIGKLELNAGKRGEAKVELSAAVTMLRTMNMSLWLPEAEAALARASGAPARLDA